MKSDTAGYDAWVIYLPILPSVRCLQKNVQDVKFAPGMLHAVFDMLEVLGDVMPNSERLSLPCHSSSHEGNANKALLFILAGIATRWKPSIRVEFTNCKEEVYKGDRSNPTGIAYKKIIEEIILKTECESVGLRVSNVTSDMGADNLAFWRAFGVKGNRKEVISSFTNPLRPNAEVFLLPDVVHLMKNTKAMLESYGTIELPSAILKAYGEFHSGLTSTIVDYKHIEDLHEFEKDNKMKVAFRLKETTLHTKKHFKKINVGTAKSVCHRPGVGLKLLVMEKESLSNETTAWFIILMNAFTLATARHRGLAVPEANMGANEEAICLIKKVSYIFSNMKEGQGAWKPVQKFIEVLCHGYLGLID
ncbi:DNA transposase [Frankliniella fusca]|uniref:DNA transposase n=1 Tax=Frankliniella fusca TaxID=407009 RepID=A0AAE1HSI4_9NEOP|nr:DNA transposase [Frankliniella fusca]